MVLFIRIALLAVLLSLVAINGVAQGTNEVIDICPNQGLVSRSATFDAQGAILTAFSRDDLWVYEIARNSRYPLPDSGPCGSNCHLSPDFSWFTAVNSANNTVSRMRLDGTQRRRIIENASEISWWSDGTYLVWTSSHQAYLMREDNSLRGVFPTKGITSIQPAGYWGVYLETREEEMYYEMADLRSFDSAAQVFRDRIPISRIEPYHLTMGWSHDGDWLTVAMPLDDSPNQSAYQSEIFGMRVGLSGFNQWTNFAELYGSVRINGSFPFSLSWSPDGEWLAFWVIPQIGDQETVATLHVLDVETQDLYRYCDYATTNHTPNPPRLVWSPDSRYIAFAGQRLAPDRGTALIALNIESGIFTALSSDVFPALGRPDAVLWGLLP